LIFALVLMLGALSVAPAFAATFTGPFADTYTVLVPSFINNPSAANLQVIDTTSGCVDNYVTYVQFGVPPMAEVSAATLTFTVGGNKLLDTNPVLSMYGVSDPADLGTPTGPLPLPSPGALLESITIPSTTASLSTVTFGAASPALRNYVLGQAGGDRVVTLAFSFSSSCGAANSTLNFYSQDQTNPANNGYKPALSITYTEPLAVGLSDFSAEGDAPHWMLVAAASALAFGVAAVWVLRRRTA
jgi:hypothetical protein